MVTEMKWLIIYVNVANWQTKQGIHKWVGRVIHWELCKWLKFDHVRKTESVPRKCKLYNSMDSLWYKRIIRLKAESQTYCKLTRRKKMSSKGFCVSVYQNENERKRKERQIFGSCLRAGKTVEYESVDDTNCSWCVWNDLQRPGKSQDEVEIRRRIESIQTTELLRSTIILETCGDLLLLTLQW